jgi:hypothetical protein
LLKNSADTVYASFITSVANPATCCRQGSILDPIEVPKASGFADLVRSGRVNRDTGDSFSSEFHLIGLVPAVVLAAMARARN